MARDDLPPLADGVATRSGAWYSSDGKLRRRYTFYEGPHGEEVPHGIVYEFGDDGTLLRAVTFRHGAATGPARSYYENGKSKDAGEYINNLRSGFWQYWYKSGQKECEGMMRDDKPVGVWRFWDESGDALTITAFPE
jgi:antitoxin component YwqK of YwqJK toxin-antitoxin module